MNNKGQTFSTTVQVLTAAPGIFTTNYYANGVASLQDSATGTILNPNNPAAPDETVTLYFTGIGPITNNSWNWGSGQPKAQQQRFGRLK